MINSLVHARLADVDAPYVFNAASAWEHIAAQCGGSVFPLQSLHLFLSNPFPALGVPFTSLEDLDGSLPFLNLHLLFPVLPLVISLVIPAERRPNREFWILCVRVTIFYRPFVCTFRSNLVESPHVTRSHDVGDLYRVLELMDSSNDGPQA